MLPRCTSVIIAGSLTIGLAIADIWYERVMRVPKHLFLGGILTGLFYLMCNKGYEMVNWVFLGIIPAYVLIAFFIWMIKDDRYSESCESCALPANSCGCKKPKRKPCGCPRKKPCDCAASRERAEKTSQLDCPAKPVKVQTACGISRYT